MILGITGGVASGKSTLAGLLADIGAPFGIVSLSADKMARELLAPGSELTKQVLAHYGTGIVFPASEPTIDRAKLANRIFSNLDDKKWLEALVHPLIISRTGQMTAPFKGRPVKVGDDSTYNLAAVEIPLLYEAHVEDTVDVVVVTFCSEQIQLRRLRERRADLTEVDALRQIRSQIPLPEKATRADIVVETEGSIDELREAAAKLFDRLVAGQV